MAKNVLLFINVRFLLLHRIENPNFMKKLLPCFSPRTWGLAHFAAKPFLLLLLTLISCYCVAQDSTKKWQPVVGLGFSTVPTYNISGIDTSFTNKLTAAPSFTLRSRSGWGITYTPRIVLGGAKSGIYMHALSVGVEQYDKTQFDYALYYTHYFFTNKTSVPYTPLNNEIFAALTYKQLWLRPTVNAGIGFGTDTTGGTSSSAKDVGLSAGVSHLFSWENKAVNISFVPSVLLNAGTNEYFSFLAISKYIGHNKGFSNYVKKGSGRPRGSGTGSSATTGSNFAVNNFEIGMESSLEKGAFTIRPSGSLFIPTSSTTGSGTFGYWQIMLEYRF